MVKEANGSNEVVTITEETIEGTPKEKKSISKRKITKKTVTKRKITKKTVKKRRAKRKISTPVRKEAEKMEKMLIENFISMQKVMTNMAEKFDGLSKQLSKLLHLFENSAKALIEKEINLEFKGIDKQREVVDKLNVVLEQNKIIAKGLTLMHETATTSGSYYSLNEKSHTNTPQRQISPMSFEATSPKMPAHIPQKVLEEESSKMEPGLMSSPPRPPSPNFGAPIKKPKIPEDTPFHSSEFSSN